MALIADPSLSDPDAAAPEAPGPTPLDYATITAEDKAAALAMVREKKTEWGRGREGFVRNAWRNILFERGHQDIVFSRAANAWRPVQMRGPRIIPTNRFSSTMGAYVSVLARIEPTPSFRPATSAPEDRATAEVASRAIEVIEEEVNIRLLCQVLAHWAGFTGGAWIETGYDPSPQHGMRLQQDDRCLACGATGPPQKTPECAACGGPTEPAVDDAGEPVGTEVPIGTMYCDVVSLFEMWFDASYSQWQEVPDYYREKSLSAADALERWGEAARGIGADLGGTMGEHYQEQLPTLAGYMHEDTGARGAQPFGRPAGGQRRVSEGWYWSRPTRAYPEGLLLIILGGTQVMHMGPLPYHDERGPMLPMTYFPTRLVPGSLWSKTVADDLASKQVERNQLCYLILRLIMRTANPVWTVPSGANIKQFTGDPGQIIEYNALGPGHAKPERVQGAGIPNGLITWLQVIDSDFEEIAATFSLLKGDRPPGVSAGIALQMIQERINGRFGSMFILWSQAWAEWARQALAIFRQFVTEERLHKIQGRGSRWRIEKFLASDLTGRIDVVAEAEGAAPRSTLVDRAELEQLSANRVIDPSDPEIREKWLAAFGRTDWLSSMKADAETAAKQIETFEALAADPAAVQLLGGLLAQAEQIQQASMQQAQAGLIAQPLPPATYTQLAGAATQQGLELPEVRPDVDGHPTFVRELGEWLKGDASQQLPKPVQKLVEKKHSEHVQLAMQAAYRQMQMNAGAAPTSGFLSNPGGMQGPTQGGPEPPSRMDGEQAEMERNAQ
jgi:hypothetical protein